MNWWQLILALIPVIGAGFVGWLQFRGSKANEETGMLKAEKRGRDAMDKFKKKFRKARDKMGPKPPDPPADGG